MSRRLYHTLVPEPIRMQLSWARRRLPRLAEAIRWNALGPSGVAPFVDASLDPGPHSWIFILGCNNSGTTLLSELLGAHPLVRTLPKEGQRITGAIPNSASYGIGRVFSQRLDLFRWTEESDARCVPRLRYDWACRFSKGRGYLLEKSPPNTLRSRWLQRHFSPARFVGLVRHPYAVCEGITRRTRYSLEEAADHWALVHRLLLEDVPHLDQWMLIRYEDLCERPAEHLARLESFLQLPAPFDASLLGRHFRSHNIDGTPRHLQNLNDRSLQRLSRADLDTINARVANEAAAFDYELL